MGLLRVQLYKENGMRKRISVISTVLMLIVSGSMLFSCSHGNDDPNTGSSDGLSGMITGADETTIPGSSAEIPDIEDAMKITGKEFADLLRSGAVEKNGTYEITDGGIVFGESDNRKEYNGNGATVYFGLKPSEAAITVSTVRKLTLSDMTLAVYGGNAGILSDNSRELTFAGITVTGSVRNGILCREGAGITVEGCSFLPASDAGMDTGIVTGGADMTVHDCRLSGLKVGISDESDNGTLIVNNSFSDCATGVSISTSDTVVMSNTFSGGTIAVEARDDKSEISACMAKVYNLLVSLNKITGSEKSVVYENVSNSVILLNECGSVSVSGCTNAYIAENNISGELSVSSNRYLIANGNSVGTIRSDKNENVNGDNLTDISARSKTGANEEILPHINNEMFIGMTRKQEVKSISSSDRLCRFLSKEFAEKDVVIIPPGAYVNDPMQFEGVSGKTIYAYGVLTETAKSKGNALSFRNSRDITIKGLFISSAIYPHLQGTLIRANASELQLIADPGYYQYFTSDFGDNSHCQLFETGSYMSFADIYNPNKTYNKETGVISVWGHNAPKYARGMKASFRNGDGSTGLYFENCSGVLVEDVTLFCSSGFAESDIDCETAPVLHRYAVAQGPAPVLDGSESDYEYVRNELWRDSYNRLRSVRPMNTSCDATHSTNARTGIKIISCRFEMMNDDAGNINAYYGHSVSFDKATKTFTYTHCDVGVYKLYPPVFRKGDILRLHTKSGKLVAIAEAASDAVDVGNGNYSFRLNSDIELPDETLVVQNLSASGSGFLIDNVMVSDANSAGFRIQATNGTAKNCTFRRLVRGGFSIVPQNAGWPECGFASDIRIIDNIFDELSCFGSFNENWDNNGYYVPITIHAGHDQDIGIPSSDPAYCMHNNILISGNIFRNRYSKYEIVASAVKNLTISDNTFEARSGVSNGSDTYPPIRIYGGNGIVIDNNTFTSGVTTKVLVNRNAVANISGSDVN